MLDRWYDVAEICCAGHILNTAAVSYPEVNSPFCGRCGAPTIRACRWGGAAIPGEYRLSGGVTLGS